MITLKKIAAPEIEQNLIPVTLRDETMQERKTNLLTRMKEDGFDTIVVYADLEHAAILNICVAFYHALRKPCLFSMRMEKRI